MAKFALIDFETESDCDLKKAGAWRYAEDPTTNIICLGYTLDGNPNQCLGPNELGWGYRVELCEAVTDPNCMFIAHNAMFEKAVWRWIMVKVFGWPDIPNERWHDSMASCAMKGIPLKLENAVRALRLSVQKDTEGTKATLAYGRTNKKTGMYQKTPEKLHRIMDYCKQDVAAELGLHRRVRGLGAEERKVWLLDQAINERGVRLDMKFVDAAQSICDQATKPLLAEFRQLTGLDKVGSPKFLEWLHAQGAMLPNLQKETINQWLGAENDDEDESQAGDENDYEKGEPQFTLPYSYRRPLEIRKVLGSASIKKLASMQACCGTDGQARGLLQYHGAGPGRWAGRLLQPQNFPRPTLKQIVGFKENGEEIIGGHDADQLVEAVLTRDPEYVRCLFGEPIEAVASGLRHALIPRDGHLFEVGDFAKIECVIVLAMAGATKTAANVIEKGSAVYTDQATKVFNYPVKKTDLKEYTIGKNIVLGCGFQMGWRKFKTRYAKDMPDEVAKEAIRGYREDFAPEVPLMWRGLEDAAVACVWDNRVTEAYGIQYKLEDGWLTARLPSGRKLWYFDPKGVRKHMPWCACPACKEAKKLPPETPIEYHIRRGVEYSAQKTGQWKRISVYGGLLTENVVQATARDLLVHAMFNCEKELHPLVLTVHDEAITEVASSRADAKLLEQYMTDIPQWARALQIPVAAECWVGDRYRK